MVDDQHVELNLKVRLSRKVKIAALLVGAASTPVTLFAGAIPWGARLAGMATGSDVAALKKDIEANTAKQQISNDVEAKKTVAMANELEAIRSSISLLGDKVKSLGFKINKRAKEQSAQ